jgi:hypothetical protein
LHLFGLSTHCRFY